jgi:hypothetical protein
MTRSILALLGDYADDRDVLDRAAAEFGWATAIVGDDEELARLGRVAPVAGVLLDMEALGSGLPPALFTPCHLPKILCARAARRLDHDDLVRFGAYDALLMPLRFNEVRQSLGFLAQALARDWRFLTQVSPGGCAGRSIGRRSSRIVEFRHRIPGLEFKLKGEEYGSQIRHSGYCVTRG